MADTPTTTAPSTTAPAPSPGVSSAPSAPSTPAAAPAANTPAQASQPSGAPAAPATRQARLSPQDVQTEMRAVAKASVAKPKGPPSGQPNQGQPSPGKPAVDPSAADPAKAKAEAEGDDDAGDDGAELPEIDENALPFDQRQIMRRWKRTLDRTREQLKTAQPHAEQYQKILGYMDQFNLDAEQVATGFDVMAKLNTNPQLAYAALKPIMDELEAKIGERLPEDLQDRVARGLTDEATARELARQRGFTATATDLTQRQSEQQQRAQQEQSRTAIHGAVSNWENQRAQKDPDFARKRPMIEDAARTIMAKEGIATNPAKAIEVLNRAVKLVEERLSPFRGGSGQPTPRQPSSAHAPLANGAVAEPTNLREAALQGLTGQYRYQH